MTRIPITVLHRDFYECVFARCYSDLAVARRFSVKVQIVSVIDIQFVETSSVVAERLEIHQGEDGPGPGDVDLIDRLIEYQLAINRHFDIVYASVKTALRRQSVLGQNLHADIARGQDGCWKNEVITLPLNIEFKPAELFVNAGIYVKRFQSNFFGGWRQLVDDFRK